MAPGSKPIFDRFADSDLAVEADLMRSINRFPFFHTAEGASRPRTRFQGREMINLGSNNYLGLADDERVIDATCEAARRWGAGSTGSRTLNGHTLAHEELIAGFTGQEAALVFSTGDAANLGAISGLVQRGDHALTDEEAHASILDGVLLSGARLRRFDHCSTAFGRVWCGGVRNRSSSGATSSTPSCWPRTSRCSTSASSTEPTSRPSPCATHPTDRPRRERWHGAGPVRPRSGPGSRR